MKKILALILAMVLAMGLVGCGALPILNSRAKEAEVEEAKKEAEDAKAELEEAKKEAEAAKEEAEKAKNEAEAAEAEAEAVEEEAEVIEDAGTSDNDPMDAYIAASKGAFDAMEDSVKDMMEMEVIGEGSTLKYSFKMLVDTGSKDAAKGALDAQMPAQEEAMKTALKAMELMGIKDPVIVLEYNDKDGELITSYEFK